MIIFSTKFKTEARAAVVTLFTLTPGLCFASDWKFIERFDDFEMFYDAASVQRDRDVVTVITLANYTKVRNRGDGEFRSKTTLQRINCADETLRPTFSRDYREHFAKGTVVGEGPIESSVTVPTKPNTVAGTIVASVCKQTV